MLHVDDFYYYHYHNHNLIITFIISIINIIHIFLNQARAFFYFAKSTYLITLSTFTCLYFLPFNYLFRKHLLDFIKKI